MLYTLVVVLAVGMVSAQYEKEKKIEYDEIVWAFHVAVGSDVIMECQDSNKNYTFEGDEILEWKRLSYDGNNMVLGDIANNSNKYTFEQQDGVEKVLFSVLNVQEPDYGLYMCIARNASSDDVLFQLQKGINFRTGPLITDLTLKYRENIITSVVATAVAVVLILGSCCLHRFKYHTGTNSSTSYSLNGDHTSKYPSERKGYDNPTIATVDENVLSKSDMEMQYRGGANGIEEPYSTEIN